MLVSMLINKVIADVDVTPARGTVLIINNFQSFASRNVGLN